MGHDACTAFRAPPRRGAKIVPASAALARPGRVASHRPANNPHRRQDGCYQGHEPERTRDLPLEPQVGVGPSKPNPTIAHKKTYVATSLPPATPPPPLRRTFWISLRDAHSASTATHSKSDSTVKKLSSRRFILAWQRTVTHSSYPPLVMQPYRVLRQRQAGRLHHKQHLDHRDKRPPL